jgi:hypothetical protein
VDNRRLDDGKRDDMYREEVIDEVGLKSLAITWHEVDHARSLVPWPDLGRAVSDRRGSNHIIES